jgi:hypothetical protein
LHATALAWANTGDPTLREKLDYIAAELANSKWKTATLEPMWKVIGGDRGMFGPTNTISSG